MRLVFSFFVFVADFAVFVGKEKEDLAEAFVGVNFCGERRGVADFECDEAFPFGFERRDVDDDAAARVGGFAEADCEHVARDAEVFDGAGEREGVRRHDADVALVRDERTRIEMLWIDDGRIDVGENLKFIGDANVVPVRRNSVADDTFANLAVGERLDHFVFERHFANPAVWLNGHPRLLFCVLRWCCANFSCES